MEKRCIFHIPNYLDPNRASASQIRPKKMMNAFEQIGYKVDIVQGYGRNRKRIIEEIKRNIDNGVKYEFLYSESSTAPTLLTEKHHFPTYPFLDFGFFKYIKDHGIKIGPTSCPLSLHVCTLMPTSVHLYTSTYVCN